MNKTLDHIVIATASVYAFTVFLSILWRNLKDFWRNLKDFWRNLKDFWSNHQ